MRWNWEGNEVVLSNAAEPFEVIAGKPAEIEEFAGRVHKARRLFVTLLQAEVSFSAGKADYTSATTNLEHLFLAREESEAKSLEALKGIDVFFNPPEISKHLTNHDELARFVSEAISKIGGSND